MKIKLFSALVALAVTAFMPMASASIEEGVAAIQAQLPANVTIASASHSQILTALERAAEADPDRAVDIAAAVVRERWPVLNGDAAASSTVVTDGKSVVDSKSVVVTDDEGKAALLTEMANAIINGATPEGQSPDPGLVAAVLQAMMFSLPAELTGIGAMLYEGVLTSLPSGVAGLVSDSLRGTPAYQYTVPPTAAAPVGAVLPTPQRPAGGTAGSGSGPSTSEPEPRPTPQPVTPVTNN